MVQQWVQPSGDAFVYMYVYISCMLLSWARLSARSHVLLDIDSVLVFPSMVYKDFVSRGSPLRSLVLRAGGTVMSSDKTYYV